MNNERVRHLTGRFRTAPVECVHFGPGSVASIAAECDRLGLSRLLLVVSASLAREIDVESRLQDVTGGRIAAVFDRGRAHVPDDAVLAGAEVAAELAVDGIVSVGGGSATDLAKAIALCTAHGVRTREQLLVHRSFVPDLDRSARGQLPLLPHIAVGTTLSAGEFTGVIGITDTVRQVKDIYGAPAFAPRVVVLDPELAAYTPRQIWVATGLKAVDHAVEALCSAEAQPIVDALAKDALRRIVEFLPQSYRDSSDLESAGQCQIAAWESIFGLPNVRFGLSHGLGHQLGGRAGIPHGITSCVLLPAVLEFNLEHTREAQTVIAGILAEASGESVSLGAAELLRRFVASHQLPIRLRDIDVRREDFATIASEAVADMVGAGNPRPVKDESEVVEILERAW